MELREYTPILAPKDIWAELGFPSEDAKLREQLANGLPLKFLYTTISVTGIPQGTILEALRIPSKTFSLRKKEGSFTMEESDRLYSLIEALSRATDLFNGDGRAAADWMTKKVPGLGHKRPIDMIDSHFSTSALLDLITRLEYGVHV